MEANLVKDWNAEWQQIDDEQKEASDAYMEAMAAVTKAFAENGSPTEDTSSRFSRSPVTSSAA